MQKTRRLGLRAGLSPNSSWSDSARTRRYPGWTKPGSAGQGNKPSFLWVVTKSSNESSDIAMKLWWLLVHDNFPLWFPASLKLQWSSNTLAQRWPEPQPIHSVTANPLCLTAVALQICKVWPCYAMLCCDAWQCIMHTLGLHAHTHLTVCPQLGLRDWHLNAWSHLRIANNQNIHMWQPQARNCILFDSSI